MSAVGNQLSRLSNVMYKTKLCNDAKKWVIDKGNAASKIAYDQACQKATHINNFVKKMDENTKNITELNYNIIDYDFESRENGVKTKKKSVQYPIQIMIEIPGVLANTINISFYMDKLILSALKPEPFDKKYLISETDDQPVNSTMDEKKQKTEKSIKLHGNMRYGKIYTEIKMPVYINNSKSIECNYLDGIFTIMIPKTCIQECVSIKFKNF